jgi:O-antigen/teichoic acid export membrane protein
LATGRTILKHSAVYTFGSFLEQSLGVLLLPLLAHVLTPAEYGVVSLCRVVSDFLGIFLSLTLYSGAARLYFDYRDNPKALREFWGTIFSVLALFSGGIGLLLMLWGEPLFAPFVSDVPFRPLILLSIATAMFNPFITTYFRILQMRQQSISFTLLNTSRFALQVLLIVYLVVFRGWGALGPVAGRCVVTVVYALVCLVLVSKDLVLCIRWPYLRRALGFSVPVLPAALSSQVVNGADRVILVNTHGEATNGLYQCGYQFGYVISVVAIAANAAFIPVFNDALKSKNEAKLNELRRFSLYLVCGYCLMGLALSLFAKELVVVATAKVFHPAYVVIPFISSLFVLKGIYAQLVSPLQFFRKTLLYSSQVSFFQMVVNLGLNFWWIPKFGIYGACWAALSSQAVATLATGLLGYRLSTVRWEYGKYSVLALFTAACSLGVNTVDWGTWWVAIPAKAVVLVILSLVLSWLAWADPLHMVRTGRKELSALSAAAAKYRNGPEKEVIPSPEEE